MTRAAVALLADGHSPAPSEAVSSGLGVWWLTVAALGLFTVACAAGFVMCMRRTAPTRRPGDVSAAGGGGT